MYHFIINPHARTGKGEMLWGIVEEELKRLNVKYTVYFTEHSYHATEIARSLTFDNIPRKIVVIGGDGTMNETINGIINFDNIVLGYIPTGSSNDLARSMGISKDPITALHDILTPKYYKTIDIGELFYGNNSRKFDVSAGIGFDAAVCHEAFTSPIKKTLNKLKLGKLTYFFIAAKNIATRKPFKASLVIDDIHKNKFEKVVFIAVMNQKYEGGGFKFCPDAKMDDGKLDVIVADSISKLRIALLLPTAFKGLHVHAKGMHIYSGSKIEITTDSKQPVHLDGESGFFQNHIIVKCAKAPLKFIVPRDIN